MMARVRKVMNEREGDKGFTLIELLVVIIIIGILAAIAIPAFLNQRTRGWEAQVESDLKNAALAAETYAVSNNGSYAGLTHAAASSAGTSIFDNGYNKTDAVTVEVVPTPTATQFQLTARHDDLTGKSWTYSSDTGVITEVAGSAPAPGGAGG
ncbi:prepilin-type N-terminal cleavage/methylation domain-containing protein [Cellulomonas sp. NPDC057328]|uniref:prepilin-type N-terminal cleavage/methylation domain-containing protein n=1 Tax=Cellulomonas sp. NPDC057328 TaxID=3346101 RepID=UPI003633A0E4